MKRRSSPQTKDIYHIGRPGLGLLLAHGQITDDDAARRGREHELKPETLEHEMFIADIHVMLDLATRGAPLQFIDWREGDEIRDTFEGAGENGAIRQITIAPDAFFQIRDTRLSATRSYFLEADRATMPTLPRPGSQRFRDKIERYRAFMDANRPLAKFGAQATRVVTITLTPKRRDNLSADTDAYLVQSNVPRLRKSFLFGAMHDMSLREPDSILTPVFRRPGSEKAFPLFPALAETAEHA